MSLTWLEVLACSLTALISATLTVVVRNYAIRKQMVDEPGGRRIHTRVIPRGGGLAVATAFLVGTSALFLFSMTFSGSNYSDELGSWVVYSFLFPVASLTVLGWLEDAGGLSIKTRLMAQMIFGFLLSTYATYWITKSPMLSLVMGCIAAITLMVSVNLYNFMDGANGFLVSQAIFVCLISVWAFLVLEYAIGDWFLSMICLMAAFALFGFLPFNFPNATVFLGDSGSYAIGALLTVISIWLAIATRFNVWLVMLIHSAFLIDATLTLGMRAISGKKFWKSHREHLYQWLIRDGASHTDVVFLYQLWNLLVVLPSILWMIQYPSDRGWHAIITLAVFTMGSILWWGGKSWILKRRRIRPQHATS